MNIDVVGFLAPIQRRGRPSLVVKIALSQIELDNRRSVFDGRANKGVLVHLRDSRLKLHLHCITAIRSPSSQQTCPWISDGEDSGQG